MPTIYHCKMGEGTRVCIVPNHYGRSLEYIKGVLEKAKEWGLTVPEDEHVSFEVLRSDIHSRKLSIEFTSKTPLHSVVEGYSLCDLDLYPNAARDLMY